MNSSRLCPCLIAGVVLVSAGLTPGIAGEQGAATRISNRCDMYGPGFMDLGNGTCGRLVINGRVRVDAGPQQNAWPTTVGTQTTGLRSDSAGILPGADDAQHLRIQNGNYSYGR